MNEQFLIAEAMAELEDSYEEFAFDCTQESLDMESQEILLWNHRRRQGTKCSVEHCPNPIENGDDLCHDCDEVYGFWSAVLDYRDKCLQEELS